MAVTSFSHLRKNGFVLSEIHGGKIYGHFPYAGGVLIRCTTAHSSPTTKFYSASLREIGNALGSVGLDDLFNAGWSLVAVKCANITAMTTRDVTDFVLSTGEVNIASTMGGNIAVGDTFGLVPSFAFLGRGSQFSFSANFTTGQIVTGGTTLATASGDVFVRAIRIQGKAITSSSTGFALQSNDTGNNLYMTVMSDTAANMVNILNGGVAGRFNPSVGVGYTVASGKVLTIYALTADLTGTGCRVTLDCVRESDNASLS